MQPQKQAEIHKFYPQNRKGNSITRKGGLHLFLGGVGEKKGDLYITLVG